ncbi:hypothetical protein MSG28_003717 [Choristoneura fumiferana]|uniref:Uncharacterized protein n=1 Tax=Choristoneura fumiferana TaxID=7141 RepID=A0ACC0KGE0_CHOFU|nr:hypothetical protein MSG28_003717 [Choristoneura fumiferana]
MFSKFIRPLNYVTPCLSTRAPQVLRLAGKGHQGQPVRCYSDYIPPNQYDVPIPNKLKLGYALRVYWEIIPLAFCTAFTMSLMVGAFLWASMHKVDAVFTTHNLNSISRTMDLRNPKPHKIIIVNQRYEPWPELQAVLDKMTAAEKRALQRLQNCSHGNPV